MFINRQEELARLEEWWTDSSAGSMAMVWGRRRVGKTALLAEFAGDKTTVFYTATGRPAIDELQALSEVVDRRLSGSGLRDLAERPFADWLDVIETLAERAQDEPVLLVLDEFPDLVHVSPELPKTLRSVWDRVQTRTGLRILLSGSAVRVMEELQDERSPLFGRLDLTLLLHPFRPHEAAMLLGDIAPARRALVWGICGGMPLSLRRWRSNASVRSNILRLFCRPGASLLSEGRLVLATEGETGELGGQVLRAIALGRTRHNEIADAVRADPSRTLERLIEFRLLERLTPVTEDPRRTRRRIYRLSDNLMSFWLGVIDRHRGEIDRGLGDSIVDTILDELDDYMGPRWEAAFRAHTRKLITDGEFSGAVAVGPFWTDAADPGEIDAVILAGRRRTAIAVGEAKWSKTVRADRILADLSRKAAHLPEVTENLTYLIAARDRVVRADRQRVRAITAADIFALP